MTTRDGGECIAGSAPVAGTWIAVEHRGPWGPRPLEDPRLPTALRSWLEEEAAREDAARAVLIRRDRRREGPLRVIVGRTGDPAPALSSGLVDTYDELSGRSIDEITEPIHDGRAGEGPILVCTNGQRDRCCAVLGSPLVRALDRLGADVWHATHLGGHRYAATAVGLPDGLVYGLLDGGDAEELLERRRTKRYWTDRVRGRSSWPRPAQAAEAWVRADAADELSAFTLVAVRSTGPATSLVELASTTGLRYRVTVRERPTEALVACHPEKQKVISQFDCESAPSKEPAT